MTRQGPKGNIRGSITNGYVVAKQRGRGDQIRKETLIYEN